MPSSHLILCRPLLLLSPIPPSIRVFSNESTLHMRWPKYQSFSFSIIPSKEHPGPISFRMDWLDLLAVQGTLKSLLQHSPTVQKHQFFSAQLSTLSDKDFVFSLIMLDWVPDIQKVVKCLFLLKENETKDKDSYILKIFEKIMIGNISNSALDINLSVQEASVQFSHSVVSNSLQSRESQQGRPPCPKATPRVHSNSCPSSQ